MKTVVGEGGTALLLLPRLMMRNKDSGLSVINVCVIRRTNKRGSVGSREGEEVRKQAGLYQDDVFFL